MRSNPIKILHILDHSLPLHSGYTFRSLNLFKAQQAMGFDPVILTSPKHEQSWKGDWADLENINGFNYYRTGAVSNNGPFPIIPEIRLTRALGKRLEQVIEKEHPAILHAHSPFLNALPAIKIARQTGIPLVYEIRAFWEDAAVDHGTYAQNSWKYRLVRAMETRVCRRADHVTVLCNGLKNDLIERGISREKITPILNGINPDDFKPTPPDEQLKQQWGLEGKKVIGFIGSFYRYEGLDLLIKAFGRLAPAHPGLVLLLVGGGEMEGALKEQASRLDNPVKSRVIFPGRIPHERVPGVYSLIDILVYPRYSMQLTDLVTPLKPLEAMAMGKALVASDVGGHKELIRDGYNGVLFMAGDEAALAAAVDRLLADPGFRYLLQERSRAWVQGHHVWDKTTAFYRQIYSDLISKSRANVNYVHRFSFR